jgi:DNA processing protein
MLEDLEGWLALARAPGLHAGVVPPGMTGDALPRRLRERSGAELEQRGFAPAAIAALRAPDTARIAADAEWLAGPRRSLVTWGSASYPPLLSTIADAPLVLFGIGDLALLAKPQLAMVGARNPTTIGRETAQHFAAHLARGGLVITSGLALGIDAASHRGALAAGGGTIAVLGSGPDRVYPAANAPLARDIVAAGGLLLSEFPPGTAPRPENFPRRNRLISGLALGTLVVEAAVHSGSLITARLAAEQGREVFAIPGSIHSALSKGCHRLIRDGAKLVETAADVLSELPAHVVNAPDARPELPDEQRDLASRLDKDYEILLDALGHEPASVDTLLARTGLTADVVASMLLILELEGRIAQQPGGIFCRRLAGKKE